MPSRRFSALRACFCVSLACLLFEPVRGAGLLKSVSILDLLPQDGKVGANAAAAPKPQAPAPSKEKAAKPAAGAVTTPPPVAPVGKEATPAVSPAAAPKATPKLPAPQVPTIIVRGDFSSLLKAPPKTATPAELKLLLAFVTSDKGNSFPATVKTLAPGFALVTVSVPSGEIAVSALIGSAVAGTPPVQVELSNSIVKKNVVITDDFSAVTGDTKDSECAGMDACATLLAADGQTTIGEVTGLRLSAAEISLTYEAPLTAAPAFIRIGKQELPSLTFTFSPTKPSASSEKLVKMREVVAGDFCQKNENGDCTTDFLRPPHPSRPDHPEDPHSAVNPIGLITSHYVVQAGDSQFQPVQLNALGPDTADISFNAPSSFKPAYLVLDTANQSYRFAYTPAPPLHTGVLNYESDELNTICDQVTDTSDATKQIPDCDHTPPERFSLKSLSNGNEPAYVAMQGNLVVARVTAPLSNEPNAIIVSNKMTKKSTIARRTIKPGGDNNLLNVDMTIMDQVTAQRNYGNRIAKRYIAVTLDVRNPTATKVQFNKSAMYFDVDYVEAKEQGTGFVQSVAEVSTLGLYQPSVYTPPFVAGRSDKKTPRVARFGLEQNVKHSPENFLSVLGSFDYTTTKTDDKLRALELVGSVLTNIATGGVVADASGAFRAGTSLFSGTFLPGVRSIVLDTSFINRLRSNLVAQTLQDTIQVPAKGSTTTIVLLPRTGILAFTDAQIPVMVNRVIDVHLVTEVVTPETQTPVKKNECTVGNSKDQTRQALGEPTGTTTNPDGSSSFTFSKGPVASADFDTKGLLVSCKSRTPTEQMDLAKTLVEAKQTLTDLGVTATQIVLTDSSTVIVDIPGVQKTYHFDSKGAISSEYTFLFKDITTEAANGNTKKADFETFLEGKASPLSSARSSEIKSQASASGKVNPGGSITYSSPDIQNGSIVVTFKNGGTSKAISLVVEKISFQGDKPKGVN